MKSELGGETQQVVVSRAENEQGLRDVTFRLGRADVIPQNLTQIFIVLYLEVERYGNAESLRSSQDFRQISCQLSYSREQNNDERHTVASRIPEPPEAKLAPWYKSDLLDIER